MVDRRGTPLIARRPDDPECAWIALTPIDPLTGDLSTTDPLHTKQSEYALVCTDKHAKQILKDGNILQAAENINAGEIPVAWFSANQFFEPAAIKIKSDQNRHATMTEMIAAGLWRFGISPTKLLPWDDLITAANIPVTTVTTNGTLLGGKPEDWFGITRPVLLHEVEAVEHFRNGCWVRGVLDLDG